MENHFPVSPRAYSHTQIWNSLCQIQHCFDAVFSIGMEFLCFLQGLKSMTEILCSSRFPIPRFRSSLREHIRWKIRIPVPPDQFLCRLWTYRFQIPKTLRISISRKLSAKLPSISCQNSRQTLHLKWQLRKLPCCQLNKVVEMFSTRSLHPNLLWAYFWHINDYSKNFTNTQDRC